MRFMRIALLSLSLASSAMAGLPEVMRKFNVYSIDGITGQESDFEGVTGAGGDIKLKNFSIAKEEATAIGLYARGTFTLKDGRVANGGIEVNQDTHPINGWAVQLTNFKIGGDVRARGHVWGQDGKIDGTCYSTGVCDLRDVGFGGRRELLKGGDYYLVAPTLDHEGFKASLYAASAALRRDLTAQIVPVSQQDGRVLVFTAKRDVSCFNVGAEEIVKAEEIVFEGPQASTFVINVRGKAAALGQKTFKLAEGIQPSHILYNFYEALELKMRLVVKGTVLAPYASADLVDGRIDGSLYVGNLLAPGTLWGPTASRLPTVQVTHLRFNDIAMNVCETVIQP